MSKTTATLIITSDTDAPDRFVTRVEFDPPVNMTDDIRDVPTSHLVLMRLRKALGEQFDSEGAPEVEGDQIPTITH
jgi:hypothetical protein